MGNTHSTSATTIGLLEAIACVALMVFVTNILPFYFKTHVAQETNRTPK